jgi:hypothetical protein
MQHHPRANKAGQVYEHIVVMERILGRPITVEEQIHHRNHVRHDNRPENLVVLPATEHQHHHGINGAYIHFEGAPKVHFIPKPDTVMSVEPDGETDVYDIRMAAPGNNFVANGIIVHNCGKSLTTLILLMLINARRVIIVCPLRVIQVWASEIAAHIALDVITVALDESAGSVAEKLELAKQKLKLAETLGVPFICVANYDSVWRDPLAAWLERQRWDVAVADECVPVGTLISTPHGAAPIEDLREGDQIIGVGAEGDIVCANVTATFRRFTSETLVQVEAVRATPNHPIWVEGRGYVGAAEVKPGDWIRCYADHHDHLRMVRQVCHEDGQRRRQEVATALLRQGVLREVADVAAGFRGDAHVEAGPGCSRRSHETELGEPGICREPSHVPEVRSESVSRPGDPGEKRGGVARAGVLVAEWRERHRPDRPAASPVGGIGLADGVHRADPDAARFRVPDTLQTRHRESRRDDCSGGGRAQPHPEGSHSSGREERRVPGESGLAGGARTAGAGARAVLRSHGFSLLPSPDCEPPGDTQNWRGGVEFFTGALRPGCEFAFPAETAIS